MFSGPLSAFRRRRPRRATLIIPERGLARTAQAMASGRKGRKIWLTRMLSQTRRRGMLVRLMAQARKMVMGTTRLSRARPSHTEVAAAFHAAGSDHASENAARLSEPAWPGRASRKAPNSRATSGEATRRARPTPKMRMSEGPSVGRGKWRPRPSDSVAARALLAKDLLSHGAGEVERAL